MIDKIIPTTTLESWYKPLCIVYNNGDVIPCRLMGVLKGQLDDHAVAIMFDNPKRETIVQFNVNGHSSQWTARIRNIIIRKRKTKK